MNGLLSEYYAFKMRAYVEEVVLPAAIRQEQLLTELRQLRAGDPPRRRWPAVWVRAGARARACVQRLGWPGRALVHPRRHAPD